MVLSFSRWLINPVDHAWLADRGSVGLAGCSHGLVAFDAYRIAPWIVLAVCSPLASSATDDEIRQFSAWARVAPRQRLEPVLPIALAQLLDDGAAPLLVALSAGRRRDLSLSGLIERLEVRIPALFRPFRS